MYIYLTTMVHFSGTRIGLVLSQAFSFFAYLHMALLFFWCTGDELTADLHFGAIE